ncbi:dolichol-phosphate mannosyltransferase subunit 3 [Strongylocentrotus purpuratus]|uniref:Dolichol-phosphate mannosyltransferase subunit 3 n=1 Tax=Strongylocentrotus purpuratus TaxID=7668 RepID=A0A7M7N0N5_STRPU|nr:dolichol-phosphate mannosyltransferase subunit 3 [Strongylocentrotus purpuratus]XP_030828440.1 dolichol-phosphate mannosyltransferase subunit 3 [Strongylocentrotus purpuratus]|eukprot:XP_001181660.2 PREDICTED: dolichol-phosphate mannosyltransferase subunit 3 [Strongylocentrotus purpuratus]
MATKLVQWLTVFFLVASIWSALLFDLIPIRLDDTLKEVIWPFPAYFLVVFGCFSLGTIGYRVATFNDCEDAVVSLKEELKEARKDLTSKGFTFS